MTIALKSLVLCLSLCLCNGGPPKEVGSSTNTKVINKFTAEEDKFIVTELLNIPGESVQIYSKPLWNSIAEKHNEKWKQNVSGFPCERTGKGLSQRLFTTIMRNSSNGSVKLPENLFRKFPLLERNRPKRATRHRYTSEETRFISEELLKLTHDPDHVQASSIWKALKKKHDAKREEGCHGFEHERTVASLRGHIEVLKQARQLPNEVLKNLSCITARNGSQSTPPGETTAAQETSEDLNEDEWVNSILEESNEYLD